MIVIKKSQSADTRTCDWSKVSCKDLLEASKMHIKDVGKGLSLFSCMLQEAAILHDRTKISGIEIFHKDFKTGFKTTEWWKMHQKEERHHFKTEEYIQEDVNLIDIIEMLTDGVMAGLARSGEYRQEEMPADLLKKAFDNTIKLLLNNVTVENKE